MIKNNSIFIRRELLTKLCKDLQQGGDKSHIDRIPIEMKPRNNGHIRCCVHKDRAVLKYKLMACLGFNIEDETDELTPLSEYLKIAEEKDEITDVRLTVVDEACSSCQTGNYVVTNMCQSCDGRPCQVNCPKDAITFHNGKAQIIKDECVNCGLCMSNCPFHAIIFTPVPCESACPVDAISKDKNGIANINHDLCIFCGRCFEACPYGAVMEKSHIIQIYKSLKSNDKVVAMIAPALYGQFAASPEQLHSAIKKLGFDHIYEVAEGAVITSMNEARELEDEILPNNKKMTTSCCPSYLEMAHKHIKELKPLISNTKTPLYYTSKLVKTYHENAKLVFISPCMAKKHETFTTNVADYTLNFEELGAMLAAANIELQDLDYEPENKYYKDARRFSFSGGVSEMVKSHMSTIVNLNSGAISGFSKENIRLLKSFAKGKSDNNFLEVMACENGCINGCNTIAKTNIAKKQVQKYATNN